MATLNQSLQCCGPCRLYPACHGYPASTPSQGIKMHVSSTHPRLTQELHSATDLALWAMEVTVQSLGKAMSTLVVQERHLWLSLAEQAKSTEYAFSTLSPPTLDCSATQSRSLAVYRLYWSRPRHPTHLVPHDSLLREEIAVLLAKDAIKPVPPAEMMQGFYSSYFIAPKKERRWSSTNTGSASLEPGPARAPIQDVDAKAHDQMHPAPRLVCSDRPSCFDPSTTQTFPTVCVWGSGMAVQGPPLRALPVSPCLHEGRRGSPCPVTGSGRQDPQLSQRLAHSGLVPVVWSQGTV